MTDPVRLTEEELEEMWTYAMAGRPGSRRMSRLLDHIAAQARELVEARELISDLVVDSSRCTCRWCERARTWLAATAQEENDG